MFIHSRLTQPVSGIIMPIVRRIDCIKPRLALAWMCWLRLCGFGTRARVLTPHNRSQHIQANARRGFLQSILLTMGIMIPETGWVNLLWINIYTCVICCFFLLQFSWIFGTVPEIRLKSRTSFYPIILFFCFYSVLRTILFRKKIFLLPRQRFLWQGDSNNPGYEAVNGKHVWKTFKKHEFNLNY